MMSIFAMAVVMRTRRSSVTSPKPLWALCFRGRSIEFTARSFRLRSRALEVRRWAFRLWTTTTSFATIPPTSFMMIFATVFGIAFSRRRFTHPRRQHF
jgi:hypothetical protein